MLNSCGIIVESHDWQTATTYGPRQRQTDMSKSYDSDTQLAITKPSKPVVK